ncbi:MAG: DUF1634 domain-containing protein [Armatimonadota bacterium]|nr:DUF1634 domain-containing protein [Armatimonadota bacterium]
MRRAPAASDERAAPLVGLDMSALVGFVLRAGVALSVILIAAGLLWQWRLTGRFGVSYPLGGESLFRFAAMDVQQAVAGAIRPQLLINSGIIVLLLTPLARVALSTAYFLLVERNMRYVGVTTFVLVVLTYSLFLR